MLTSVSPVPRMSQGHAPGVADVQSGALCSHCGLSVPAGLIDAASSTQFCCHGCQTAYGIIRGCGLERYYHVRDNAATERNSVSSTGKRYRELDDQLFTSLYCTPLPNGAMEVELFLEGVHCAACVWLVERLPTIVPGCVACRLDPRRSLVHVTWEPAAVPLSRIAHTLDSLGYAPHPARDAGARVVRRLDDRRTLIRLGVAGACAGNVMLLALALYAGVFDSMDAPYLHLFRWTSMLISLVSLAWPGSVFFRGAWAALRAGTPHLDVPIAMGLGIGGIWSVISTIRGEGEIYFDSLSVLVFALLVGRWVQKRQQRWASDSVELLFSLTPTSARLVERDANGVETVRDVSIETLGAASIVEVRAGDSIPADGVVTQGQSSVDESLLSGESRPVEVARGDRVAAGAVNLSEVIRVRVEATGEQTRVGKLMRLVEEGASRRAPIISLADRTGNWFVGIMVFLAACTVGGWLWVDPAHPERAIGYAAALLIVTCPCGLGLATPLAMTIALGRAAKRGILVKGGDAIERLAKPGQIFLDKTGTLTRGRLALVRWVGGEAVKPMVAALEATSSHPIALALVRDLSDADSAALKPTWASQTIGGGIEGEIEGKRVVVGAPAFVLPRCIEGQDWAAACTRELSGEALTPVLVAVDGRVVAAAGLGDPVRADAQDAVVSLRRSGWKVGILSGDHADVVRATARTLGIDDADAHGAVTPEKKVAAIASTERPHGNGPVVMVGDGVNDAAALATADVGIAVHGGAEASLAAADVYLNRPGLGTIAELLAGSRRTMRVIHVMFAASIAYNVLAAGLSMFGYINPILAAVIMPASSLTVVALAVRMRSF